VALIYLQIVQFFGFTTTTNIKTARDLSTVFPTVTFCNFNIFDTVEGNNFLNDALLKYQNIAASFKNSNKSRIKLIQNQISLAKSYLLANSASYTVEQKKKYSRQFSEMVLSCYFGSKSIFIYYIISFFSININIYLCFLFRMQ
jgi:hypothetical protein